MTLMPSWAWILLILAAVLVTGFGLFLLWILWFYRIFSNPGE